ncbi:MAG: archaetidylserine decarboxylase [Gammaproteobacteria bacterium]|nr:archaetidylserine decarboxylase [Gammaproteobacteria bacterium]
MLSVIFQTLLPHHLLSRLMLRFLRIRWTWLKNLQIRLVIKLFNVDMTQVATPDLSSFEHFNAFFTRAMKPEARPIAAAEDNNRYCSPVDGTVSQFGNIQDNKLMQAKGIDYSLLRLVGAKDNIAGQFSNGHFATIYLSPRDYHRIHMPAGGRLISMTYIPGRLFSVADQLVENLPNLFTRNERVVCLFETDNGPMAVILVGAIFVGCMDTVWHGTVSPPHRHCIEHIEYEASDAPVLNKGEEMGRFNMGSTVIVLWPDQPMEWDKAFTCSATVQMGQEIAAT